jgi:endogenous inhibitor of DNA gyrase (YacG/DUF329 family)
MDRDIDVNNLFLRYANLSLKNNPQKLFEILSVSEEMKRDHHSQIREIISNVIYFAKIHDEKKAVSYLNSGKFKKSQYAKEYAQRGFDAVYQSEKNNCYGCFLVFVAGSMNILWQNEQYMEPNPKCFQCYQAYFAFLLDRIIRGEKYSEIEGLEILFLNPVSPFNKQWGILYDEKSKTDKIVSLFAFNTDEGGRKLGFNRYLFEMSIYSLANYLEYDDRRKIKKCPNCYKYYVRRRLKEEKSGNYFCSAKCRLSWHNEKRIKSGAHAEYKRKKRKDGASPSYYG